MWKYRGPVKLVILDTAGTICDGPQDLRHIWPEDDGLGVKAPVVPFYETLKSRGVILNWTAIRKPMGLFKKDHLRTLLEMPEAKAQFKKVHGRDWTEKDLDEMFEDYKKMLNEVIVHPELAKPIPGAVEVIQKLRDYGKLIGNTTGYTAEASKLLNTKLEKGYGIKFDFAATPEIVKARRPYPWMVMKHMEVLNVYPPAAVVKVGDTKHDIREGKFAGAWTVGLYKTGNDDFETLAAEEPDYLIPSIAELLPVIWDIENRLKEGRY
ncbi:MAG: HAD hydrolase-like protein [Candidatus Methanomethylicaceae archaeon]|nr:HAD hydrolase-like protein [Candidatus Verstraetearchaeota archaeon]